MTSFPLSREDLRLLRPHLLFHGLPFLAGLAILLAALYFHAQTSRRVQSATAASVELQRHLERFQEEQAELEALTKQYDELRDRGIVGPEQRTQWMSALRELQARRHLRSLRYVFGPQESLDLIGAPAGPAFAASPMQLDVTADHEGDVVGFLDDLKDSRIAHAQPRRCTLGRADSQLSGTPGLLHLECRIDWITLRSSP